MIIFDDKKNRYILYAGLLVFFLLHLYRLNAPPNGYHQWRESDTAAITLNYFQEDANFFQPRCNQRGSGEGITGSELPVYNYSGAMLYFVFGPHHFVPRLLTTAGGMLAILFFFLAVRRLSGEDVAAWSSVTLAFSPLFFFYSYKIMPDVWMLLFLMMSLYLFVRHTQEGGWGVLGVSAAALILSACIKPLGLSLCLPMLLLLYRERDSRTKAGLTMFGFVIVTFGLTLLWYLYARHLNELHGSPAFYMGHLLEIFYRPLGEIWFYKKLFLQWPFELWIGWTLLPAFVYGCYRSVRHQATRFYLVWIVAAYIAFVPVSHHSGSHDYYTLIIVAPLAVLSGFGLKLLFERTGWRKYLAVALAVIAPVGACVRVAPRFGLQDKYDAIRSTVDQVIERDELVMVEESTMAIRLYQLNRHGWPVRGDVTLDGVRGMIDEGADWLVLDRPLGEYDPQLAGAVDPRANRIGPLFAYRITESD
ncbi:MAG: hypothetical protein GY867_08000 [bacterium]|nr:hypothetical protein [bacterium]